MGSILCCGRETLDDVHYTYVAEGEEDASDEDDDELLLGYKRTPMGRTK